MARRSVEREKVAEVMHEYKVGRLRSGSRKNRRRPKVRKRKQAIAIALSEARRLKRRR